MPEPDACTQPGDAAQGAAAGSLGQEVLRAIDQLPAAVCIVAQGCVVFANRACLALLGVSAPAQLLGRPLDTLLLPESAASVRRGLLQALDGSATPTQLQERIRRCDGTVRDVEIAAAAMPAHGRSSVQLVLHDVSEQTRATQALQHSRRALRQLATNLVDAREAERRRIARELHDELGQRLSALKLELSALASQPLAGAAARPVGEMLAMVEETVASVRRIATDLRPAMLDDLGLNTAIEWLAHASAQRMGVALSLQIAPNDPPISEAAAIALYRMVQETLTNIARHARATAVRIAMDCDSEAVWLTVQDNGVGFGDLTVRRSGSHGLLGMRERCQMLGGQVAFANAPEGGARITIRLPLLPPADSMPGALDPLSQDSPRIDTGSDPAST